METSRYWQGDPELALTVAFDECGVRSQDIEDLYAFINPLKIKSKDHYDHSVRVALLATVRMLKPT